MVLSQDEIDKRYESMLRELYGLRHFGIKPGLSRIETLLQRLDNPQNQTPYSIQVGGTNGKGSTVAFIASVLKRKMHVGCFTSPHLLYLGERIVIHDQPASREDLLWAATRVFEASKDMVVTFFEVITAMAALLFARASVEVVIWEVGMGGRLDSTTVMDVDVAVITGVALDHQQYLGNSLAEIAREKSGIWRHNGTAILGTSSIDDGDMLLMQATPDIAINQVRHNHDLCFHQGQLGLSGKYQRDNAACAEMAIATIAQKANVIIDEIDYQEGFSNTSLLGRMDHVHDNMIVDGAHNSHACHALFDALETQFNGPWVYVVSISKDKNPQDLLTPFLSNDAQWIVTQANQERSMSAHTIKEVLCQTVPTESVMVLAHPSKAIEHAIDMTQTNTVVCFGSLYLAGEVYRWFNTKNDIDPIAINDPL